GDRPSGRGLPTILIDRASGPTGTGPRVGPRPQSVGKRERALGHGLPTGGSGVSTEVRHRRGVRETMAPPTEGSPARSPEPESVPKPSKTFEKRPFLLDFFPLETADQTRLHRFYDRLRAGRLSTTRCPRDGTLHWPRRTASTLWAYRGPALDRAQDRSARARRVLRYRGRTRVLPVSHGRLTFGRFRRDDRAPERFSTQRIGRSAPLTVFVAFSGVGYLYT